MPRPIPVPDELSKPFWDACNERRLVVQNCTACNRMQYPPEKTCLGCGSGKSLAWREVSGRGRVDDYVVVHDSRLRLWQAEQPYNVALIALEEDPGVLFLSNLPGIPVDQVPVGASVQADFEEVTPGQLLLEWRVVSQPQRPAQRKR
ncbi:MAG: hypothetical protein HW388_1085 [Dehalococcoidia bacterium]|nr:hypothetical protein [Dehalococcoidia bacterium]